VRVARDAGVRGMVVGVVLFALAAGWTAVTAAVADSSSLPVVGLIVGTCLAVGIAWFVARHRPSLIPAGIVGAAVALALVEAETTFDVGPLQGPFGYANSSAAFFGQASVAALLLLTVARGRALRAAGALAFLAFVPIVLLARSWAVAILLPGTILVAVVVTYLRGSGAAVVVCGAVFIAALLASVAVGATGVGRIGSGDGFADRLIAGTISEVRVTLWHEALAITADEPLFGVGPGRFEETSPTASSDPDLRWAHNEFFQAGAESGLPGFILTVSLFLWGFGVLWLNARGMATALGAAALATLGAQASLDYVLHFPAVVLAGGAILGSALGTGVARRRSRPASEPQPVREFA
jgi:O-antigen ligase